MLDGKRAYICSPLSATTKEVRQQNMEKAKFYLMQIKRLYHCRTFASHAHLPLMLDDEIPEEQRLERLSAMICGFQRFSRLVQKRVRLFL